MFSPLRVLDEGGIASSDQEYDYEGIPSAREILELYYEDLNPPATYSSIPLVSNSLLMCLTCIGGLYCGLGNTFAKMFFNIIDTKITNEQDYDFGNCLHLLSRSNLKIASSILFAFLSLASALT